MSKKKPSAPPPDYKKLWASYDRWRQEDKQWYDAAKEEQEKGADVSSVRARMASSGLRPDTPEWDAAINEIVSNRPNIDAEYAAKQADLKNSLTYKDLVQGHKASEAGRQREWDKKMGFSGANIGSLMNRADFAKMTGPRPTGPGDFVQQAEFDAYQKYKAGSGTNRTWLPANRRFSKFAAAEADPFQSRGFEDWGVQEFGSKVPENVNISEPTAGESAMARAKTAAGGRRGGSNGSSFSVAAFEENPWA